MNIRGIRISVTITVQQISMVSMVGTVSLGRLSVVMVFVDIG